MKIILDSNVIIAAVAARGLCAEILSMVIGQDTLVISELIWKEVRKALQSKLKVAATDMRALEEVFRDEGIWLSPLPVSVKACRDKNDLHILGLAARAQAEYIVSGDKDLFELKVYGTTKIVSPREYWTIRRS